jgi:hypothetical protein
MNYLVKKVLPKLVKKHLGIRKKFRTIGKYEKKTPKEAVPIFIHNYFMGFVYAHFFPF